jgi:ABC-type siderophore export system fused ATPase/permease subunit
MSSTYNSKQGSEGTYIYDAVKEEEDASRVAILAGCGEDENIVVLDEHVRDAGVVVDHRRVHFRVALPIPQELRTMTSQISGADSR